MTPANGSEPKDTVRPTPHDDEAPLSDAAKAGV